MVRAWSHSLVDAMFQNYDQNKTQTRQSKPRALMFYDLNKARFTHAWETIHTDVILN